jgi:hypothetical protein
MVKKLARSSMRVKGITGNPDHARCKTARNIYAEELRVIKTKHWAEWLAGLDKDSVWMANKLGMGPSRDGEAVSVPTLLVRDAVSRDVTKHAAGDHPELYFLAWEVIAGTAYGPDYQCD